jgi:hypothetical protein
MDSKDRILKVHGAKRAHMPLFFARAEFFSYGQYPHVSDFFPSQPVRSFIEMPTPILFNFLNARAIFVFGL